MMPLRLFLAFLLFFSFGSYCLADSTESAASTDHTCLASNYGGFFQSGNPVLLPAGTPGSNTGDEGNRSLMKSEEKAFLMALGPGFFLHGLGHAYAGDGLKFGILCASGLVGGYYLFDAFKRALGDGYEEKLSSTETVLRASAIGILFFGSWVFDMIFSPDAVRKHNEEVSERYRLELKWKKNVQLSFRYNF